MNFIHSTMGGLHFWASLLALIFGTWVLTLRKGTLHHKRIGYLYTFSMLVVNGTAFCLYGLFGRFGVFHVAAIVSLTSIVLGLLPLLMGLKTERTLAFHISFLYFSVFGLYAALVSEVIVRVPGIRFWWSVAGATFVVIFGGMLAFRTKMPQWMELVKPHVRKRSL